MPAAARCRTCKGCARVRPDHRRQGPPSRWLQCSRRGPIDLARRPHQVRWAHHVGSRRTRMRGACHRSGGWTDDDPADRRLRHDVDDGTGRCAARTGRCHRRIPEPRSRDRGYAHRPRQRARRVPVWTTRRRAVRGAQPARARPDARAALFWRSGQSGAPAGYEPRSTTWASPCSSIAWMAAATDRSRSWLPSMSMKNR